MNLLKKDFCMTKIIEFFSNLLLRKFSGDISIRLVEGRIDSIACEENIKGQHYKTNIF